MADQERRLLGKHVESVWSSDSLAIRFTEAQLEAINAYNSRYKATAVRFFVSLGINTYKAKRERACLSISQLELTGLLYGGTI